MSRYVIMLGALCAQWVLACGSNGGAEPSGSDDAGGSGPSARAGEPGVQTTNAAGGEPEQAGAGGARTEGPSSGGIGAEAGTRADEGRSGEPGRAGAGGQGAKISDAAAGAPGSSGASGGPGCPEPCAKGRICLRGTCVSDCGADLEAIDEALADDVAVVAHFCRTPAAVGASWDPGMAVGTAYELGVKAAGKTSTLTVSSWRLDPALSEPDPVEVFSKAVVDPDGVFPDSLFPSSYVAVSGARGGVAVGYTNLAQGGLMLVADGDSGSVRSLDAPGNYSAAWTEAEALLVNGLGAGDASDGQGLYWISTSGEELEAVNVATHIGTYSGSVAVAHKDGLVFAGGMAAADAFFVLALERLRAAALGTGEPVDASKDSDIQSLDLPSNFDVLSERRLLTRQFTAWPALDVNVVDWTLSGGKVVPGAPHAISRGEIFSSASPAGHRILLQHSTGLLLVELDG